jgi:hypothetical protein
MRTSPKAFFLEKAMELKEKAMQLKGSDSIYVEYTESGVIAIEQWSHETRCPVTIYITVEQFRNIEKYVREHYLDILAAWNDGVE